MKRPLEDAWIDCPTGELSKWAARRRRQRRARIFGVLSVALLLAVVSQRWWAGGVPSAVHPLEPNYGGIVCSAVRSHIAEYVEGRLDAATRSRIEAHVASCPLCRWEIEEARGQRQAQRGYRTSAGAVLAMHSGAAGGGPSRP